MTKSDVLPIDDHNFDTAVLRSNAAFLVDFTAAWCGPCKALAPVVERLASDAGEALRVGKLDVDESPTVAARYGVRSLPTVIVFRDGKEVGRHVGVTTEKRLRELAGV